MAVVGWRMLFGRGSAVSSYEASKTSTTNRILILDVILYCLLFRGTKVNKITFLVFQAQDRCKVKVKPISVQLLFFGMP